METMRSNLTGQEMTFCRAEKCLWHGRYHVSPCRPNDWAVRKVREPDYGLDNMKDFLDKQK